jgi:hypothetical protein
MQREILLSLAAGLLSAVFYLSTKWGILGAVVFALFSPLPLFAAGLGLGLPSVAGAALTATITVALVANLTGMVVFAIAYAAPVLLVVRFALLSRITPDGTTEWYPPGRLLVWITFFAIGVFTAATIFMGAGPGAAPGGLQAGISGYVDTMRALIVKSGQSSAGVDQVFATIKLIFPFIVATWWMMIMVVNGVLAQKILRRRGLNKRPAPDLRTTALPLWLAGVMVAASVAALLGSGWLGFLGTNIALILCVPYFLVGLAVVHTVSAAWSSRTAILFAVYVLLLLFSYTSLLVAGIGYSEHWAGLRKRFGGPDRSHERKE